MRIIKRLFGMGSLGALLACNGPVPPETVPGDALRKSKPVVELTDVAAEKVREFLQGPDVTPGSVLFLSVKNDGPTGYMYSLGLEDNVDTFRTIMTQSRGISIAVEKKSIPLLQGTTIDYEEGESGSGFRFHNPNAM